MGSEQKIHTEANKVRDEIRANELPFRLPVYKSLILEYLIEA
jgi:hypothetical protein